jgi:pimeloyl-ACP methyl ester carboxylesterase
MENKLIFNNREYELIEIQHPSFIIYDEQDRYSDIGYSDQQYRDFHRWGCKALKIKDKFYGLKLIEHGK